MRGDVRVYSMFKVLGVAEGSILQGGERKPLPEPHYGPFTPRDRELSRRLRRRLDVEHCLSTVVRGRWMQALVLRATAGYADYYSYLCRHYRELCAPMTQSSVDLLSRVDTSRIAHLRRELARRYLDGLDPRLMFDLPEEAFTTQPLMGFPIRVGAREQLQHYLLSRGIRGTALADRWWFVPGREPSALWRSHYLLPIGHYLSDREIDRVIEAANAFVERQ